MTDEDIEEFRLATQARQRMEGEGTDWVALPTNYDARKNLSLAKNIAAWYQLSALPCTSIAIEKSGQQLTTAEFRECLPRPESSAGIIIAAAKHPLMEFYLKSWAVSDGRRNRTRRREILQYVEYGVISADQATIALEYDE